MKIIGITMYKKITDKKFIFRLMVSATEEMREAWIKKATELYGIQDVNTKSSEKFVELFLSYPREEDAGATVEHFFENYENLEYRLLESELKEAYEFIQKWKNSLQPNDGSMGDLEWLDRIPDDIPWKKNIL